LYLAIVLDLFNRQIVGWSIQSSMAADIATNEVRMAWLRRKPLAGLIRQSDRGSRDASKAFQDAFKRYDMSGR
jgi:putative transposase